MIEYYCSLVRPPGSVSIAPVGLTKQMAELGVLGLERRP